MSSSYTLTATDTFTITHARHMAAKVAADLKRMQRLYGSPDDAWIAWFETEIVEVLKEGYLETVTYGYQRDGNWIEPTLKYTASDLVSGADASDDDPGKVRPGASIVGASFHSYLIYSSKWNGALQTEKNSFITRLPFSRTIARQPGVNGYLSSDRTYSSGGRALNRASVRSIL